MTQVSGLGRPTPYFSGANVNLKNVISALTKVFGTPRIEGSHHNFSVPKEININRVLTISEHGMGTGTINGVAKDLGMSLEELARSAQNPKNLAEAIKQYLQNSGKQQSVRHHGTMQYRSGRKISV